MLSRHYFNFVLFFFFSEINHDHHMCCSLTRCHCNYFGYQSELMLHVIWTKQKVQHTNFDVDTFNIQMGIITESWGEFTAWHFYDSSVPNNVYRAVISFAQHAIKKKSSTKKIWISETVFKATIQGSFKWFSSTEQLCSDFIAEKTQKTAPSRCLILFLCRIETLTQELVP